MSRKTPLVGLAAIIAGAVAMVGSAEAYGANAQQADVALATEAPMVEETVPVVFVTEEVAQPLPETEAGAETSEDLAENSQENEFEADTLRDLLTQVDAPSELSRQMEGLAGAVYFESRGEPINGQLAVAQVVINRAESNVFPADYCGVVYQRAQFSFVKGGRMPRIARGSGAWRKAKKIARIAHEGLWESEAQDSLYFHANYVKPKWSNRKKARATIKTHIFYR